MKDERATLIEVLLRAEGYLRDKGCPAPRLDAQLLLAHVLECDRVRLYVDHAKPLSGSELIAFRKLLLRRGGREPVAYLVGVREFWSMPFRVDRRVLIPRPDSETLVEEIVELFADRPPGSFADIGTGSGCLAGALARSFPGASGVATDSDPGALVVAAGNIRALGLQQRVEVRRGHLVEPLDGRAFDLVCANLPYVPTDQLQRLDPDIRLFEPLGALDGGGDGLSLVHQLVRAAPGCLAPGGWLALEVGDGQARTIAGLCRQAGLQRVHTRRDLSGTVRVVAAKNGRPACRRS